MKKLITFLMIAFIFSNINAQVVCQFNTNLSAGTDVSISLNVPNGVTIDWGDGNSEIVTYPGTTQSPHTYATEGTYTVNVSGGTTNSFSVQSDKLINVTSWGSYALTSVNFINSTNLTQVPTDLPATITYLGNCFQNCTSFNQDISTWGVSNVTDMRYLFAGTTFNQDISGWNTSNVTNLSYTFASATAFNQDLSNWDVSSVTNASHTFEGATSFNSPLNNWNFASNTNFSNMFKDATSFNQDISSWNVSSGQNFGAMFSGATAFNNQSLNSWDVSSATNMISMFYNCTSFNQDLNNWDVSNVTTFWGMFYGCTSFNGDISSWTPTSATTMNSMFFHCYSFNVDINNWDVSSVGDMRNMFIDCTVFNQNLNSWDVSSVFSMENMFSGASAFNGGISSWDVSAVYSFKRMFLSATSFNQDISGWNTSSVTDMFEMLRNTAFNQDISSWDVSKVATFGGMLREASSFNQDLSSWDFTSATYIDYLFYDSNLSPENYDAMLIGWDGQAMSSKGIDMGSIQYTCAGETARSSLVNKGWTFSDGGLGADNTNPVTPTLADVTGECSATATAPTTTDACAGTITGTTSDVLTYTTQGTHVITWNFDDGNGNSINVDQNVVIEDVTNPTISCLNNQTVDADNSNTYTVVGTEFDPTATDDNCGVASILNDFNNTSTLAGVQLPEGTTTINWTVTDNAGNTKNCSFDVLVAAYVGISDLSSNGISIYPNPTNGIVNFDFANNSILNLTISDITGKQIFEETEILQNEKIDLSGFDSGVYIINIQKDNEIFTTKIIKK